MYNNKLWTIKIKFFSKTRKLLKITIKTSIRMKSTWKNNNP